MRACTEIGLNKKKEKVGGKKKDKTRPCGQHTESKSPQWSEDIIETRIFFPSSVFTTFGPQVLTIIIVDTTTTTSNGIFFFSGPKSERVFRPNDDMGTVAFVPPRLQSDHRSHTARTGLPSLISAVF